MEIKVLTHQMMNGTSLGKYKTKIYKTKSKTLINLKKKEIETRTIKILGTTKKVSRGNI